MLHNYITKLIKRRTSIRSYTDETVSDNDVNEILSAGLYAPSGKNRKPWRFFVIKDKHIIKQISKLTVYSRFIRNAPVLILLYIELSDDYLIEKDMLSAGACLQNILLVATEKNYGTCVIGELFGKQKEIENILDADSSKFFLVSGITIGKTLCGNNEKISDNLEEYLLCNNGRDVLK